MFDSVQWKTVASGRVNADGTVDAVFGCTITKGAAGLYTVNVFSNAIPNVPQGIQIPANRLMAFVTAIGATPRLVAVNDTSDSAKLITIFSDAGAATDNEFCFVIGYFLPAG